MGIACIEDLLNAEDEEAVATTLGRKGIGETRVQEEIEIETEEVITCHTNLGGVET